MTDAEIKQALKDASLYLEDAAKAWPRYKRVTGRRFVAAQQRMSIAASAIIEDMYRRLEELES